MNIINKRILQNRMFCLSVIIIAMILTPIRMRCAEHSHIVVSKKKCILYVINSQDTIAAFRCGVGKNFDNKTRKSDYIRPQKGHFVLYQKKRLLIGHMILRTVMVKEKVRMALGLSDYRFPSSRGLVFMERVPLSQ